MNRTTRPPFHLAIPVTDLAQARAFYGELLGCAEGRSAERWVDFNFHGHQLVCHLVPPRAKAPPIQGRNAVDGDQVPVPHFGVVLEMPAWEALAERLRQAEIAFVIEPRVRFAGEVGEQGIFFLLDPSGNALEFKTFRHIETELFAH